MSILRKIPFLYLLLVVNPVVVSAIYYYQYASPQYVTEAHYILRGSDKSANDILGMLTGMPGQASAGDSLIAQDYILSNEFLSQAKEEIDLKSLYTQTDIDWWASLRPHWMSVVLDLNTQVSNELLLSYWKEQIVDINYDSNSGITTLEITAFQPENAVKIANIVLKKAAQFINNLTNASRSEALTLAKEETAVAKQELEDIRAKIRQFGDQEQIIVPEQQVLAEQGIVTRLKSKLINAEAELTRLSAFLQPRSMEIRAANNQVALLKKQIAQQQSDSKQKGKTVTQVIQKTNTFQSELLFAEKIYLAALSSLRVARLDVKRKQQFLDIIVHPQLPSESLKPEKISSILSVFFTSFMLWGIVSLLLATVKDHIGWV